MDSGDVSTRNEGAPRRPTPIGDAPARIGRYIVLRRLGEGAMGVVYAPTTPSSTAAWPSRC